MKPDLAEKINDLLPQTQCQRCTYAGCKPYAQAIANGDADINQCPPGCERVIAQLAELLNTPIQPLNPEHGIEGPVQLAVIDEPRCIGCTKCIQACPVDAIIGAGKLMHTVIADHCTGCELCIPPCPVDCIDLVEAPVNQQPKQMDMTEFYEQAAIHRERYDTRLQRLERLRNETEQTHKKNRKLTQISDSENETQAKQDYIAQARARTLAKRQEKKSGDSC